MASTNGGARLKALIVIDPDRCSMVAENRTTLRTGPPSVLAAMARHPLLCLHRGSPRLGAGGIGTLDRALWLSLYALLICVCVERPRGTRDTTFRFDPAGRFKA